MKQCFAIVIGLVLASALFGGCSRAPVGQRAESANAVSANFVGSDACAGCHVAQAQQWRGSHHQLAMQTASAESVLGNFADQTLQHHGATTRFFRRGAEFRVETQDAAGRPRDFRIAYTFGVYPLQQYLIAFPDGRHQALTIAWDSRPKQDGGQRWFDLQHDEPAPAGDALHWTGPYYNWNSRCAECHTTGLSKNYDAASNRYATTAAEYAVGCESCHGAGSIHVQWAATYKPGGNSAAATDVGLAGAHLAPIVSWARKPGEATAQPLAMSNAPTTSRNQVDACGGCHSRRQVVADAAQMRGLPPYHDAHVLALPVPPTYHADGQVRDEDFELGSFLQSRMHERGVVCSNCHEPHSLQLRAPGNGVCAQCHDAAVFDTQDHHHHASTSTGARCAACHMPVTTYMVVHDRHDHSLRIPRPDLTVKSGTPNACNGCHVQRSADWAAGQVQAWRKASGKPLQPHFSDRLASDDPGEWLSLAADLSVPGIARAAAISRLSQQPSAEALSRATASLNETDRLARRAAVSFFELIEPAQRVAPLAPLASDPVKSVRLEVARLLSGAEPSALGETQRATLMALFDEYVAALQAQRDMPGEAVALGMYHLDRGQLPQAEEALRGALRVDAHFVPAAMNLADLYRQTGRESDARNILESSLRLEPQAPALHHALGLQRARARDYALALQHLRRAHELAPEVSTYGYVYAVALHDSGSQAEAVALLQRLNRRFPDDMRITQALAAFRRDAG
jgi:predicted CXXCH cytochrome family protein